MDRAILLTFPNNIPFTDQLKFHLLVQLPFLYSAPSYWNFGFSYCYREDVKNRSFPLKKNKIKLSKTKLHYSTYQSSLPKQENSYREGLNI